MKLYLPLFLFFFTPAYAVPVVPNFSSGQMSATTRTTQNITETIVSTDYNTGHTYTINGTNLSIDGTTLSPPPTAINETVNGTTINETHIESEFIQYLNNN